MKYGTQTWNIVCKFFNKAKQIQVLQVLWSLTAAGMKELSLLLKELLRYPTEWCRGWEVLSMIDGSQANILLSPVQFLVSGSLGWLFQALLITFLFFHACLFSFCLQTHPSRSHLSLGNPNSNHISDLSYTSQPLKNKYINQIK